MTMNRNQTPRGQPRRNRGDATEQGRLERRRAEMHAAEGHAGTTDKAGAPYRTTAAHPALNVASGPRRQRGGDF